MLSVGWNLGTQDEQGDVVLPAGPRFGEELVGASSIGPVLSRAAAARRSRAMAESMSSVAVLHKPVAVEDKDVAGTQRRFGRGTRAEADTERLPDGDFEDRGGAAVGHEDGWEATGAGGLEVPASGDARRSKAEADGGGEEALAQEVVGEPVEAGQDVRGAEAVVGVTADSRAEPAHGRRRSQVVTGDITNGSEDRPRWG